MRLKLPNLSPSGAQPVSQEKKGFRQGWPVWLRQMPRLSFPPLNENFQLIDPAALEEVLSQADTAAAERIRRDMRHMDGELLRLFRRLDYEAKAQQNRYRVYQITYLLLAALATLIGSIMALATDNADLLAVLAFGETLVALLTTYLATISGREPPLPLWMQNRRRAEHMRREYFRYLCNLEPYDTVQGYEREMLLSKRAADINRGFFPGVKPDEGA
jgi:hypothetical protein